MKILLLNPPPIRNQHQSIVVPPLGLLHIGTTLKKAGYDVAIKDAFAENMSWQDVSYYLGKERPDILGLSGITPIIESCYRAARTARPLVKHIIIGGPHPTIYRNEVFRHCPEIDFAVIGEGEITALELISALVSGGGIDGISGVISGTVQNQDRPFIADISHLPIPDRSLLRNELYRYPFFRSSPVTTMFTSRGCPYSCIFCDKSVFGNGWRARSAQSVLEELDAVVNRFKIKSVILYDDLFTLKKERVVEICEGIIRNNFKFEWKCEGRVNIVDEQVLKLMKRAGCSMIAYGVENGNQAALDYLEKGVVLADIENAFRKTREAGIKTMAYFILGIPVNSYEDELRTIEFAKRLNPDYAQFGVLTPFLGTKLYDYAVKSNSYLETKAKNPVDKHDSRYVVFSPVWDETAISNILKKAHWEFYFRPHYVIRFALSQCSFSQLKRNASELLNLLKWLTKGHSNAHCSD